MSVREKQAADVLGSHDGISAGSDSKGLDAFAGRHSRKKDRQRNACNGYNAWTVTIEAALAAIASTLRSERARQKILQFAA